ncbi:MAG: hypothetical protein KDB21_07065 [Acidimicrobiales bacterium]|nr:hypothetical protein [Acidimicrobiales bacterium]
MIDRRDGAILAVAVGAVLTQLLDVGGPVRLVLAVALVLWAPGASLVRQLRLTAEAASAIAVGTSISAAVIVSEVLVVLPGWSTTAGSLVLALLATIPVALRAAGVISPAAAATSPAPT